MKIARRLASGLAATDSGPRLAAIIPFVAIFAAGLSPAQADAPNSGSVIVQTADVSERHDGFFLRMATAPAVMGTEIKYAHGDVRDIGGSGLQTELAIGGSIAENLILHADFLASAAFEPSGEFNDARFDYNDHELLGVAAVGIGLTYYIMPYGLYFSGSLMSTAVEVVDTDNGDELVESVGGGIKLMFGKEWWVSDNWGLGLAASVYGGEGDGKTINGEHVDVSTGGAALLFSATYN
jgi:hypothetical protein